MAFSEFYKKQNKLEDLLKANKEFYLKILEALGDMEDESDMDEFESSFFHDMDEDDVDVLDYFVDAFDENVSDDDLCVYVDEDCPEKKLTERLIKKSVVRGGVKKKKFSSDRKGYRIVIDPETGAPKEVKMSGEEKRNRKRAQKLGAKKRKVKSKLSALKRAISQKKRQSFGLVKK